MMLTFLIGLQIFLAILLVVIILLQNGKGADIGSAFGSGNNNGMLGPIESGTVLTTITWILVFLFFINTLGISVYQKINLDTELEIFSELNYKDKNTKTVAILEVGSLPPKEIIKNGFNLWRIGDGTL